MVYLDTMPLRFGHFRVLITTAMGQFLGAAVATLSGVLIPLLAIVQHHELDSVTQGLIASMELIGIMVGSFVIGKLADKDGYLPFLRLSSILVFIGALVVYVSGSIDLLIPSLFVMGFGIGGDFALDSDYVDEVMPKRWQETMVGITKSFSALGNLSAAGGFLFLCSIEWTAEIWRQIFLFVVFLSFLMIISRLFFFKSPGFLIAKGKFDEARQVVKAMLGSDVEIPSSYLEKSAPASNGAKVDLFKGENLQKVIFSGVPWGCSGLGVYGIGSHASYSCIHELLLHADAVLQAYTFIESLEREVFDERYTVYLYVVYLCTELDRFYFLASYNRAYIMTVNADNTVPDLPAFKQILFLYKNLSDDGKTFLVILGISERGSMFSMDFIPLYEKLFKESDHTALEHPCP